MASQSAKQVKRIPSLWQNRNYLLLWGGQAISDLGTQVSALAFPLLTLLLTHSAAQAGLVGAIRAVPYLVLGLPAGALVDRWNRKRVMIVCDTGRAAALGSVAVMLALGTLTLAQIYLVAVTEGTLYVFFSLAETAALPRVVSKEQLTTATAQNEATISTAYMVGPALGGLLYGIGRALPFATDALSYVISVASLLWIRLPFQGERPGASTRTPLLAQVREGVVWLWRQPLLRFLAALSAGGWLVEVGYTLVVIVQAQGMGASSAVIGVVLGAGGVGSILGALVAGSVAGRVRFGRIAVVVHWLWALFVALYAIAPNPLALAVITTLAYGITPVFGVTAYSYRLSLIPDKLQG
ncbi:MAG TPA: MFS transporter, partial [Ktedonobacterales bacterium]|nr:MFS transporter [Ktedonobacterales bacterium]